MVRPSALGPRPRRSHGGPGPRRGLCGNAPVGLECAAGLAPPCNLKRAGALRALRAALCGSAGLAPAGIGGRGGPLVAVRQSPVSAITDSGQRGDGACQRGSHCSVCSNEIQGPALFSAPPPNSPRCCSLSR